MNSQIDASIPVLTEIIRPEQLATVPAEKAVRLPEKTVASPSAKASATMPEKQPAKPSELPSLGVTNTIAPHNDGVAAINIAAISEEDWQTLEQTLRENVLRQVLARVDFVLEHRVRDNLADVLQIAVEKLSVEIRSGLHKTLEEVITRAVTQEITKAKSQK
ncbi:hypothetical protein [Undibacterium sp. TJN19]|uniref:hypothetical protein n=1 Tax=Undibacterium sp. TJN19 TaxID=3413055 RepID=UPI003BF38632